MTPSRIAVVGAGLSGMATAFRCRELFPAAELFVFEQGAAPGGVMRTEHREGFTVELGPNGFLDDKPEFLGLCNDLGLGESLVRANPQSADRFIFLGDRLRKLPATPGAFLRSDVLSLLGRLRFLSERFRAGKRDDSDESLQQFGYRRFGREATDVLLDAVVTGIYAGDPALLSLPACFPRLAEMERTHGSLLKAQMIAAKKKKAEGLTNGAVRTAARAVLAAPAAGMGAVGAALHERLGDALATGVTITSVKQKEDGAWTIRSANDQEWTTDVLVLACPAERQAALVQDWDATSAAELNAIPYTSAVVASVGYRKVDLPEPPNGFGYLAPERLGRPVLGVVWTSSIFPEQAPADCFQFRAILGGWRRRDVVGWDDDAIVQAVRDDLRTSLHIVAPPVFQFVYRWERAIPQYHVGHLARLARIEARTALRPGLFLTGNCFRGVSVSDCAKDAARTAERIAEYLKDRRSTSLPS